MRPKTCKNRPVTPDTPQHADNHAKPRRHDEAEKNAGESGETVAVFVATAVSRPVEGLATDGLPGKATGPAAKGGTAGPSPVSTLIYINDVCKRRSVTWKTLHELSS